MKLGINALQVRGAKSGVGQYIACLLEHLLKIDRANNYLTFANIFNHFNFDFKQPNYYLKVWGSRSRSKAIRLTYEYGFLPQTLKKEKLDVFHGASNLLPLRKVCPYLVSIHDMSYFVDSSRYHKLKVMYWRLITHRTIKLADAIITDSQYSKHDILRFFDYPEDQIIVIPMAPHPRFIRIESKTQNPKSKIKIEQEIKDFQHRYKLPERYILCVSTLEPGKNLVRLIQAFDLLIKGGLGQYGLVLVGDKGWLYKDIFNTIDRLGLKDRVIVTGHVSDSDLVIFYNTAKVFVMPSVNEGFGLPVLEAMACGVPVVASNTSALPEVAADAALLVNPYRVEELAEAINRIINSPSLQEDLIGKGLKRAQEFSWEDTAKKTLAVYQMLAN